MADPVKAFLHRNSLILCRILQARSDPQQNRHLVALSLWWHHGTTISSTNIELFFCDPATPFFLRSYILSSKKHFLSSFPWFCDNLIFFACLFLDLVHLLCLLCPSLLLMPFTDFLILQRNSIFTCLQQILEPISVCPKAGVFSTSIPGTWLLYHFFP